MCTISLESQNIVVEGEKLFPKKNIKFFYNKIILCVSILVKNSKIFFFNLAKNETQFRYKCSHNQLMYRSVLSLT